MNFKQDGSNKKDSKNRRLKALINNKKSSPITSSSTKDSINNRKQKIYRLNKKN